MAKQGQQEDRRIQRTRQALQQAFVEVVRAKGTPYPSLREMERNFTATSIQEITERANVNRGTFYLHYTDKYMLADAVIRERYHQVLANALPPDARWDHDTVRQLSRAMLSSLEEKFEHQPPTSLRFAPVFERVIQEELTTLLVAWFTQAQGREELQGRSGELVARVVSWAILGTAVQWSQEETTISRDEMAEVITQVVMNGVARLADTEIMNA